MAALGPTAWLLAWLTGWEELAVAAAALLATACLALLFAIGRTDFVMTLQLEPQRLTAGERAVGSMLVRNANSRPSLPVGVELAVGENVQTLRVPSLGRDGEHDELFTIPTSRRAVITVGPALTVRGDPLGLIRREHLWTTSTDLYVHPRIALLDRLGSGFLRDLEGQTTLDLSPSDVAFHTLREYVPGDDLRHIHWKTTARIGTLMIRQFVDTRRSLLAVLLGTDGSDFADDDEFELAVSMATSLGVRALRDAQTVRVAVGAREIPVSNAVALLDAIAGIEFRGAAGTLHDAVTVANHIAADASLVVVATGSVVPIDDLRRTVSRIKSDGRVLVLRADARSVAGIRTVGNVTVFEAPDLDEFGRLLFLASRS